MRCWDTLGHAGPSREKSVLQQPLPDHNNTEQEPDLAQCSLLQSPLKTLSTYLPTRKRGPWQEVPGAGGCEHPEVKLGHGSTVQSPQSPGLLHTHWVDLDSGFSGLGRAESPAGSPRRAWGGPLLLDRAPFLHKGRKPPEWTAVPDQGSKLGG